jgi:TonB family protein
MYFDFEDYRPDITPVQSAISWREGVLLSVILHLLAVIVLLASPRLFPYDEAAARRVAAALALEQQPREAPRFVYVAPYIDRRAPAPPPKGDASDQDRVASAPERAAKPENQLPRSRGNSFDRVESSPPPEIARGRGPDPDAPPQIEQQAPPEPPTRLPESQSALNIPSPRPQEQPRISGGLFGEALRNLRRTMESEQFNNPQGGLGAIGPGIQFDTKGVEFGPWLRRFVEQVKRNWQPLIPNAAAYVKGHVVLTFNIHKDGTITDLVIAAPCPVEGFNNAAYGAMRASNPTYPLPPEYPSEQAFFTVTFFYNEQPAQ